MKARLENNWLMVDFNYRGWNPEEVIEMNIEQFARFTDISECNYGGFENMELVQLVHVIVTMTANGELTADE